MMMDDMMGGFGWLWMLAPLLLWVGLLVLVVGLMIRLFPSLRGKDSSRSNDAEGMLRERFARGEIDSDEYESSLRILREEPNHNGFHNDELANTETERRS